MDEAHTFEALARLTLNIATQRHNYPQGLLARLADEQARIFWELSLNHTPRAEWLANRGKEEVSAKHCNQHKHAPGCSKTEVDAEEEKRPSLQPYQWRPIDAPDLISPKVAHQRLMKGETVKDPLGNTLIFGKDLLTHWQNANKTEEDIDKRLAHLDVAKAVVKQPNEIWLDEERNATTYLAAVHIGGGRTYPIAFTKHNGSEIIDTYWIDSKAINSKRTGRLIYER